MKFSTVTALFLNLCFRIVVLIHLLSEKTSQQNGAKPVKQWMDYVSKRIFLININGLNRDFLNANATPFVEEMVRNYGFSGILKTSNFETNEGGLKAILTGRTGHSSPFFWSRPKNIESFLSYAKCKCGMGQITLDLPLDCYYPEQNSLQAFLRFPSLFDTKNTNSCLYIINFDLDPVLVEDYASKLSKIDQDLKMMANTVEGVWNDNKTTYILTSGRGSPVGDSLTMESPIAAWGKGIANVDGTWVLRRNDLAAMLCVLMSINFPTGLIGVVPLSVMDLTDTYKFEWTFYTIKHFEKVLKVVNTKDHYQTTAELEVEQLYTRLNMILAKLRQKVSIRWLILFGWFIISHVAWGIYLLSVSAAGYGQVAFNLKGLFLLVLGLGITLGYYQSNWQLKIMFVILLWLMFNSHSQIQQEMTKTYNQYLMALALMLAGILFVMAVGNEKAIFILFAPIVLWPAINGTLLRLNVLFLATRFLSGVALSTLIFNRVYGEMPHTLLIFLMSVVFIFQTNVLFYLFKRPVDLHMKSIYLLVILTSIHTCLLYDRKISVMQDVASIAIIYMFFFSLSLVSGSLLERLMKIFLSLFVPVQMFAIRIECIFYFVLVLQMFTWLFIEYHSEASSFLKFSPAIFSVEAVRHVKKAPFSIRNMTFFIMYVYVSYYALGHDPDLHFYDLYVMPKYFFRYPIFASYFLVGLKFFIPFFVPTLSFLTLTNLREKDGEYQLVTFLWALDTISCIVIIFFGFINKIFLTSFFPGQLSYVVVQQCGNICIIVSYMLGSRIFLLPDFWSCFGFRKKISDAPQTDAKIKQEEEKSSIK